MCVAMFVEVDHVGWRDAYLVIFAVLHSRSGSANGPVVTGQRAPPSIFFGIDERVTIEMCPPNGFCNDWLRA